MSEVWSRDWSVFTPMILSGLVPTELKSNFTLSGKSRLIYQLIKGGGGGNDNQGRYMVTLYIIIEQELFPLNHVFFFSLSLSPLLVNRFATLDQV